MTELADQDVEATIDVLAARPQATLNVTYGAGRLLRQLGYEVLLEVSLPNHRRADVFALSPKGHMVIVEVKSCLADFAVDQKWQDYLEFCDQYYFAVDEAFPIDKLPESHDVGLIVADQFGGAIIREAEIVNLSAARRKAALIRFGRMAAMRFWADEKLKDNRFL